MEKWSFQRTRELMTPRALRGMAVNEVGRARISMMVRSMGSNSRPDTLVQDRTPQPHRFLLQRTAGPYMGSKAPFRVRIRRVRYCSHRYRIAALRQHTARPAKPRKLTSRQELGDDNGKSSRGHPGHDAATRPGHSSLKFSGTSPNFFSMTASENSPTFGSPARLNATAPA